MICGLDEAGRGPLAGPVCAAAVILPPDFPRELLDDSKKLSPRKREEAERAIYASAALWGLGWASHTEIDELNIHRASLLAMRRAFSALEAHPRYAALTALAGRPAARSAAERLEAIADGRFTPDIPIPCRALIKADAEIPEVMAASILAKTARDREMERYARLYPQYGYEQHKGYPTKRHYELLARFGPSPIQRMTFRWH
jgi:ribonuclease HII